MSKKHKRITWPDFVIAISKYFFWSIVVLIATIFAYMLVMIIRGETP